MKFILFDKVLFEGTNEECEKFRKDFLDMLWKLDGELKDTYPMKSTDTWETYFEALKVLNPFVHEKLSFFKEWLGEYFYKFYFYDMCLPSVSLMVYTDLETKKFKAYTLGFLFNTIVLELYVPRMWRIEE